MRNQDSPSTSPDPKKIYRQDAAAGPPRTSDVKGQGQTLKPPLEALAFLSIVPF